MSEVPLCDSKLTVRNPDTTRDGSSNSSQNKEKNKGPVEQDSGCDGEELVRVLQTMCRVARKDNLF
jgi:hypothetical protein